MPPPDPTDTDSDDGVKTARDPFFDPWWVPKGDNAWALVGEVVSLLVDHEVHTAPRLRLRKERDEATYMRMVAGLICGLVHHCLHDEEMRPSAIGLSKGDLSRAGRYQCPVMVKALPGAISQLASRELAYVKTVKGIKGNAFAHGRRSTVEAGHALIDRMADYGIEAEDLAQDPEREIVVLKRARKDRWDERERIDYRDDATTVRLRTEVRAINAWIADANLDFSGVDAYVQSPDLSDRMLLRYFNNGTFTDGGRLFGGFWQPMRKADRREGIRIDGKRVAVLDYAQMAVRILYGMAGARPPDGDLYVIPGYEHWRAGFKVLFNAMLNVDGMPRTKPKGSAKLLPARPVQELAAAMLEHHAPIASLLRTMIGPKVMRVESDIMVDVLLGLQRVGIVALPIHDAIVVPVSRREEACSMMVTSFRQHVGFDPVVTEE